MPDAEIRIDDVLLCHRFNFGHISCYKEMNLCSTFSLDGIHVHLDPPLEITPLKFSAWYNILLLCNDPRANWVLDGLANGSK